MKLLRFKPNNSEQIILGMLIDEVVFSIETLINMSQLNCPNVKSMDTYLSNLPGSHNQVLQLYDFAILNKNCFTEDNYFDVSNINILPPVANVPLLIDFGLTPKHLKNSALTMLKYETKQPIRFFLNQIVKLIYKRIKNKKNLRYYKCNHNSIIGQNDEINWANYTAFLDIEPELGIVVGQNDFKNDPTIAGYVIFNDSSARDIQFSEMLNLTGPSMSKDFDESKGIGPYLVTADEIENPLALAVEVKVGDRYIWNGHTSEYTATPQEVIDYTKKIFTLHPGTIIGMGTIPYCCGLDNDKWILPGDTIDISFEKIGVLRQKVPSCIEQGTSSKWGREEELKKYIKEKEEYA